MAGRTAVGGSVGGVVVRLKAWPKPVLDRDGNPKRSAAPVAEKPKRGKAKDAENESESADSAE